uniref:Secreted protein n=1 Tax=Panstrongylus lignarius TaxID=156445 RepID=A0A224Y4C2_9HEMI
MLCVSLMCVIMAFASPCTFSSAEHNKQVYTFPFRLTIILGIIFGTSGSFFLVRDFFFGKPSLSSIWSPSSPSSITSSLICTSPAD